MTEYGRVWKTLSNGIGENPSRKVSMTGEINPRLRVGRIGYANCTPIFMALEEQSGGAVAEMVNGVPTELNAMLAAGAIDISPSSSILWLENPEEMTFLPDLSISSIGAVESVCLFSNKPLEQLGGATIGLTGASATSKILLKILLQTFAGVNASYVDAGEGMGGDALLLIGDQALKERIAGKWLHVYDLGELWLKATGTPFVFALWTGRRDRLEEKRELIGDFYRKLVSARQLAYRSYPRYAQTAGETQWMGPEELVRYWGTISYDLTAWHLQGLKRFASEAVKIGAIDSVPEPVPYQV